uniref:Uncharacterized protein n=1 Tax=Triticum urartu TaxID=4572 RepID=A0A8R7QJF6_TRIUA
MIPQSIRICLRFSFPQRWAQRKRSCDARRRTQPKDSSSCLKTLAFLLFHRLQRMDVVTVLRNLQAGERPCRSWMEEQSEGLMFSESTVIQA